MSDHRIHKNFLKLNKHSIPVLIDEDNRLAALYTYKLLDTECDEYFDAVTRSLAEKFELPVAAITLVDQERIWFKSIHGVDTKEIPRDPTFCSSAILSDTLYEIEDTNLINTSCVLVTGELGVRYYAGAPLIDPNGYRIGMVCVLGQKPHKLDQSQRKFLRQKADEVMDAIILRKSRH